MSTPTSLGRAGSRRGSLEERRERWAWLLLVPSLLVVVLVAFYPLLQTLGYSFTNARMASLRPTEFVALDNYLQILTDRRFLGSVLLTVKFTVATVFLEFVLGLALALVMHGDFPGRGLARAAILVPWAIPTVMSTQIWKWMYHDIYGVVNDLVTYRLPFFGGEPQAWAADPALLFGALCAVDVWKTTPFVALLLLAGLQVIPGELYEAAEIDGASPLQRFVSVTLPLLRPAIAVALIFRTMDALRAFDLFYVMVGNRPGFQTMAVLNQQILVEFRMLGQGSAMSVVIFLILAVFVALYVRLFRLEES